MSTISEIKKRKLGLLEILALGYDIYLKNLKLFLILFCVLEFPSITIITVFLSQNSSINSLILFLSLLWLVVYALVILPIYYVTIAAATENLVLKKETRFKTLISRIFPDIGTSINLNFRLGIAFILRLFLLVVPGIVYLIKNGYCLYAFVLRGQKGKAAFAYSRTIVKGNWWIVLLFLLLSFLGYFGLAIIFDKVLNTISFLNSLSVSLLSRLISGLIETGLWVGSVLLFLNLDYQKSLES